MLIILKELTRCIEPIIIDYDASTDARLQYLF